MVPMSRPTTSGCTLNNDTHSRFHTGGHSRGSDLVCVRGLPKGCTKGSPTGCAKGSGRECAQAGHE